MKILRAFAVLALALAFVLPACATSGDKSPSRLSDIESRDRTWRFGRPGDYRYDDWKIDEEQDREEWRRLREKWKDKDRDGAILDEDSQAPGPGEDELPPGEIEPAGHP